MNILPQWSVAARAAGLVLAAGFAVTVWANWPGHLSYDSILQLLQGRTGLYNTWHPPVMAWLLGLGDALVPGTGLFVAFDAALAFGALAGVLLLAPGRAGWPAAAVALAIVLSPQLLIYQGIVWKDVLFADAAVAGFVCLAHTARSWNAAPWTPLVGSFLLLALAALTRQNGAVLLPFAGAALGWIATREGRRWTGAALLGAGFLAGLLAFVFAASALLNLRSDGESGPAEQFRLLQIYDLSGAVAREPGFPLPTLAEDDPDLERVLRQDSARLYTPLRNDPLASAPQMQAPLRDLDDEALAADWRSLVLHHPGLYLRIRAADFAWVAFTPDIVACRPIFTGIEGPASEMRTLGLAARRDGRDLALEHYGKAFLGTPVLSHIPFAIVAVAGIWLLLRRRRPADIAMAAMLGSALAFAASFFVITISCDYRYLYALDLSALAGVLYLALEPRSVIEGMP
ncbi:MAG: hypothetical protein WDM86_12130 [Rhizomicrobium sp.]